MPEFLLTEFKHPLGRPKPKIIFTKGEYDLKVKMPGWDELKEAEPKDNDPYNPPGGNQFLSTYNRLGFLKESKDHFSTTTKIMLDQHKLKHTIYRKNINKPIMNYLTFHEKVPAIIRSKCDGPRAMDYRTTMQTSYQTPEGKIVKPLSYPKIPWLQNRKLRWNDGLRDEKKFFDSDLNEKICQFQKIKGFRTRSYDPAYCEYTDGTKLDDGHKGKYELTFKHVNSTF